MTHEENVRRILFGNGIRKTDYTKLAETLGEKRTTVYYWKNHPLNLDFKKVISIAEAVELSDAELVALFRGGEK